MIVRILTFFVGTILITACGKGGGGNDSPVPSFRPPTESEKASADLAAQGFVVADVNKTTADLAKKTSDGIAQLKKYSRVDDEQKDFEDRFAIFEKKVLGLSSEEMNTKEEINALREEYGKFISARHRSSYLSDKSLFGVGGI